METVWRAELLGSLLRARAWSGRVASVHDRAVNVLRPDGLVVSFLAGSEAMTDLGIVVSSMFAGPLPDLAGRPVVARAGRMRIDGIGDVELSGAAPWSGKMQPGALGADVDVALPAIEDALARHARPGGMLGLVDPTRESPWSAAARAILARDRPDPAALVGLGPGMTPSGDDFLAGVLLAQCTGWGRLPLGLPPGRLRRAVAAALPRTTPAGRTLLQLALRRRFTAPLLGLATAGDVGEAARALCGFGETSGTDTLVGCWWACMG